MRSLRWPVRLYVAAVIAVGIVALAAAPRTAAPVEEDPLLIAALLLVATVGKIRPAHLRAKVKITVDDAATFAAALLLGPFLSMLIAAVSALVGLQLRNRMSLHNRAFNAAASSLSTGAAAAVYLTLAGGDRTIVGTPVAVVVAAAAKYLTDAALVDGVAALQLRRNPLASWWPAHRPHIAQEAALLTLGALAAIAASAHPWALLLFLVPMAIILVTLDQSTRMRQQTRAAIVQLADLIDLRDKYTYGHSQRVADLAERIARYLKLPRTQIELVREAARLHDIGKIGTADNVLQKQGSLEADELAHMRLHAEQGQKFLAQLPDFWEGAALVGAHHERPDGQGYPRGLRGSEVPFEVSIIAVADAYDAMATDRPYRAAMEWDAIRRQLVSGRDTQWHARAVDALLEILEREPKVSVERPLIATRAV